MRITSSSAYYLVLPLLVGLAAFSSKDRFPDHELTLFFSWSLLLVLGVIFVRNFKYRGPAIVLFAAAVLMRALALASPDVAMLQLGSIALYAIITIVAGACLLLSKPVLILRQMYWLSVISVVMSLLQMHGVSWAQDFGSAIEWKVPGDWPVLFERYSLDFKYAMSQSRPDGFTHSNNLTSQLLLFFYAYAFFHYSFRTGLARLPRGWFFIICFACALNAGKVIVLAMLMIHAVAWLVPKKPDRRLLLRSLGVTFSAYLLYFILYPGLFVANFNLDWFIFNAMGRIINLQAITGITTFQPLVDLLSDWFSNEYLGIENPERWLLDLDTLESFSGIAFMIDYLMLIVPGAIVGGILLLRSLRRLDHLPIRHMRYFVMIMLCASIGSIFGGPFVTTVWFMFFLSFSLVPLTFPYLSNRFRQSLVAVR